ncbi:MAG: beta-propeller fold lactonase family protein [Burkholderiales bacterium]
MAAAATAYGRWRNTCIGAVHGSARARRWFTQCGLCCRDEDSHTNVVFRIDGVTGKLTPTGTIVETGSPSCIVFATR